jgi:tetratricopeptide (TPR) repeat protein
MAPEQHLGKPVDARSDIYAFGVAFYEALYGERPFTQKSAEALLAAKEAGVVPDPPEGSKVPGWLRAQVIRCLAPDPSGRPQSVAALLAGLQDDPRQRRRRTLVGMLVATVVVAVVYGLGVAQSPAPDNACANVEAELSGIWDEPTKERIRKAFVATGKTYAVEAWEGASAALDARVEAWLAARQQECEESARRTRQTPAAIESRICLDRRLKETAEITRLFLEADAVIVENAITVASNLPPVGTCEEGGWHPRMGTVTVLSNESEAFESLIARARVLQQGGKYPEGVATTRQALALAEESGDGRGEARALVLLGALQNLDGRPAEAERTLHRAAVVAEQAGDDRSAAEAWTMLIRVVGRSLVRPEEGLGYADLAKAKIARAEDDPALVVALEEALGTVRYVTGDLEAARGHQERALEERTRMLGRDHPRVGKALMNLGSILEELGEEEAATVHLREGVATLEAALGPNHPTVGKALNNFGASLMRRGRLKEAEEALRRSVSVLERALGSDHPVLAMMHMNLCSVARETDRLDDAEKHARRALELLEGAHGVKHPTVAVPHRYLAVIAHLRENHQLALEEYERARTISTAALGPESVGVGHALLGIGTEQLHLGRREHAVKSLERCVAIYDAVAADPDTLALDAESRARSRFMLARAVFPSNPERARALAMAAREHLEGTSSDLAELRNEIDAWLAELAR